VAERRLPNDLIPRQGGTGASAGIEVSGDGHVATPGAIITPDIRMLG
jgi:hypothetical protein